jgi:hypothetical protein
MKVKERFGALESDFPQLGKKPSPFASMKTQMTTDELRSMLFAELKRTAEAGDTVFVPPPFDEDEGIDLSDENAAAELVRELENPNCKVKGFIPNLVCPELDELTETTRERAMGCMTETSMECSVFPRGMLVPVQHHNETTSSSTLLIGTMLWIIWPPTEANIGILHRAYEDFSIDYNEEKLEVANEMNGGVVFVQSAGEGLRILPYCIMLGLATEASVLAKYSTLTAIQFIGMLRRLPLLESWWKTEINGQQKRGEFARALLPRFQRILAGEFDVYPPAQFLSPIPAKDGPLYELVRGWDKLSVGIAMIVDAGTTAEIKKAWTKFLTGVVGRNCAICGRYTQSKMKEMPGHFASAHWPEKKINRDQIDLVEGTEVGVTATVAAAATASKKQVDNVEDKIDSAGVAVETENSMEMNG